MASAEELKAREWDNLPQTERDARIAEHRANSLCYGICQGCGFRIQTLGKDWPKFCPRCGHG